MIIGSPEFEFNPFNAEAAFVESTRTQRFLKTIYTLSCWYWIALDENPHARVPVFFSDFLQNFVIAKVVTSNIRVKE